jgi:hypothetical protein
MFQTCFLSLRGCNEFLAGNGIQIVLPYMEPLDLQMGWEIRLIKQVGINYELTASFGCSVF